jgi:hypothetical protein
MKKTFWQYSITIVTVLCLLIAGYVVNAGAQVPTKTIIIYNNSTTETLYPVLAGYSGDVDLWLQAQLGVRAANSYTETFCSNSPIPGGVTACPPRGVSSGRPPALFRAFINPDKGILPQQWVSINVPFYTQLTATNSGNLGKYSSQYVDWWNAARVFFYDGNVAKTGAFNYDVDQNGHIVSPPPSIVPYAGAAVPACATANTYNCEAPTLYYYIGGYPTGSIPFQLGEYTFAAAEGPPPGGLLSPGRQFSIDLTKTNFNISAVDGVYLPVAMEAMLQNDPTRGDSNYLGTVETVSNFNAQLGTFTGSPQGTLWPYYWPSYFYPSAPTAPQPNPPDGEPPYLLPSIPSANVVFAESYKLPDAPAPPVISSNTMNGDGANPILGTNASRMVSLWNKCTTTTSDKSLTCQQIRTVYDFFLSDWRETCHFSGSPSTPTMLTQVYGWAQFAGCSAALADNPGYTHAITTYCTLQYNYLIPSDPTNLFNPYTQLIHKTLGSNAYAFSIDDKAAFKSVPSQGRGTSPGLIFTIGGPNGLPDKTQVPLPNFLTYKENCHG